MKIFHASNVLLLQSFPIYTHLLRPVNFTRIDRTCVSNFSFFLSSFLFFHAENAVERNIIVCQDAQWKSASRLSCAECFHQQLCRLDTRMVSYQSWELRGKMKYRRDVCFLFFPSLFFLFFLENFQILLYFVQRNKKSILVILELCRINLFDENRLFLSSIVSFALRNILNEFLREMKYRMETIFFLFLRFPIIHFFFLFFFSFFLRINSFNF